VDADSAQSALFMTVRNPARLLPRAHPSHRRSRCSPC
jgi:hypothetical protein